ncbi:COQ9 family protein [Gemmobacter denitrificans]|uniref:COQ9 family protein n=1 Tax=Gemmobacter denitrificans TaxID=3123040 RepID=A0ABU8BXJ6_9RHOB
MTEQSPAMRVLEAALPHVPFDGWSDATLKAALTDSGIDPALGAALFPRGPLDLALAYHRKGDACMVARLADMDLGSLRFRDRIAAAVMARLDLVEDKELVRRGTTFFALPHNAAEGGKAIWGTADAIWTALGDTSDDLNWYSKRATLSAVYSATVLFWLGDDSPGQQNTREFLDRRIENVMQFEKLKAGLQANPLTRALLAGPMKLLSGIRAPHRPDDLPGTMKDPL